MLGKKTLSNLEYSIQSFPGRTNVNAREILFLFVQPSFK
jgi:hypothetical protein